MPFDLARYDPPHEPPSGQTTEYAGVNFFQYLRLKSRASRFLRRSEPDECRFVCDVVQSGQNVVDIGAHKGAYTYWLSRAVGPAGHVYAFEPQPQLAQYLRGFAARRGHRHVAICPVALSDSARRQQLSIPKYTGWATLEPCADETDCHHIDVQVATLDEHLASIGAARPIAFIKCDVELHEAAVLRGSQQVLAADSPMLLVESRPVSQLPAAENPTFQYLNDLGYAGYFFAGGELIPLAEFSVARFGERSAGIQNFVFLHRQRTRLVFPRRPYAVEWLPLRRSAA
ncbi:MAG: FkbM family methyltransferase [Pirellulaceae bacterium]